MLSAGWFGGQELGKLIDRFDHWVAFVVLFLIGAKMIKESVEEKEDSPFCKRGHIRRYTLFILILYESSLLLFLLFARITIRVPHATDASAIQATAK